MVRVLAPVREKGDTFITLPVSKLGALNLSRTMIGQRQRKSSRAKTDGAKSATIDFHPHTGDRPSLRSQLFSVHMDVVMSKPPASKFQRRDASRLQKES
jgi:hypothetical protein